MTTLINDSFGRANESPITTPYATPSGFSSLQIISNQVANISANTDSAAYDNGNTYPDNQWSQVTIATVGGGDFGPAVRVSTTNDLYLCTNYNGVDVILFKIVGGGFTQIGQVVSVYALGDNIYLEAQGDATSTTLVVKKNGSTILTVIDATTPITGGKAGIFGYDGSYRISNLTAGDFLTGGDTLMGQACL